MTGWWARPIRRSAGFLVAWLIPAMLLTASVLADTPGPIFQRDPVTGAWAQLPVVNGLATLLSTGAPASGACDKLNWPVLVTTRVKVFDFPRDIVKTATPLTANIQTVTEGTEFQVPVGQVASWRVTIRVTNTNSVPLNDVEVHDNFGAEFAVSQLSPSQGTVQTALSGAAQKVHLTWKVGSLAPNATATLELVATTKLNPAGRQEYTSPGVYQMNSGATLTYRLPDGSQRSATSETIQVTAVSGGAPGLSVLSAPAMLPVAALEVQQLRDGEGSSQEPAIPFTEEFQPLSESISRVGPRFTWPAGFEVPEDLRVEWQVILTVRNTLARTLTGVSVSERLGAELELDETTIAVSPDRRERVPAGAPYSQVTVERIGNARVSWTISRLDPGAEAALSFTIYTRMQSGQQAYASPTPPTGPPALLNSGAVLKYPAPDGRGQVSEELPSVPVWVKSGGYLRVTLDGNAYEFQIRKPGTYAAEPLEIGVFATRRVALTFSGFADLEPVSPGHTGALPVYYGFGDRLPDVTWVPSSALNSQRLVTLQSQVGTEVTWRLWPKLDADAARAGEYLDSGILTFTLLEGEPFVDLTEAGPAKGGAISR